MTFSVAILATVLAYTWVLQPITPRWTATLAAAIVVALAVAGAARRREWGLAPAQIGQALMLSVAFTAIAAALLAAAGVARHTWRSRLPSASELALLFLWALGQQFALQISLLRESQAVTTRAAGVAIASVLFAALHLPNPFLTTVTFVAALAWCAIYDRHPNVLPLALSHALLTVVVLSAFDDAATGRLRVGIAYLALH